MRSFGNFECSIVLNRCFVLLSIIAKISSLESEEDVIIHQKVIIVGAGISGFASASKLLENNITSFRILEAEDRIGGRIHSVQIGQGYADLGAEYVHGEDGNLVFELSKEYMEKNQDEWSSSLYYSDCGKMNNSLLMDFFGLLHELEVSPGATNISLSEAFSKRYHSEVLSKYESIPRMKKIAKEFEKTVELIFLTLEGSSDWHFVRSKFHNFKVYPGNPMQSWSGLGYKTIFDVLRKRIGEEKSRMLDSRIHLNKTVTGITTRGNHLKKIYVDCKDGTKLTADHVIFTASLGVLKHDHKTLFHPALDESKVSTIETLGIGGIMKIVLLFPEIWWKNKGDAFLIWSEEYEEKLLNEVPFGPLKDGKHWLAGFHCVSPAPNNPKVLTAWIAGHLVPQIEMMSDEEIIKGIMHGMRKFFGKDHNIPEPTSMIRSKWCTNPHFRGSFSYEKVEVAQMDGSPHSKLLEPVEDENGVPRIYFAGEATHPNRFTSADGALASGFMQAEKLIKYLKDSDDIKDV